MVGLEDKTIEGIKKIPAHLALVERFHRELQKEKPQSNGEITFDYAIGEWVKRGFHDRFRVFYVDNPGSDPDMVYMEIKGEFQGA